MKILIINMLYLPLQVGGAEKSVGLLAEALTRRGDEVVVISLHRGQEEIIEDRNGVRVYRLPLDNLYWPLNRAERPSTAKRLLWHLLDMWNKRAAQRVGQILDIEKPDTVHTNILSGFSVAVWSEVKRRNIRLVHTLRDYYMLCTHSGLFRNGVICGKQCGDCKIASVTRRRWSGKIDAVVANSEYVLGVHLKEGYFKSVSASVIYNIADTALSPVRSSCHADTNILTFGYIGRVEEEKGIEIVLAATARLSEENWRLKVAGVGREPYVASLKTCYPDPRIEWLGFTQASDYYSAIDVSLISSVWPEPLPRTLIETFTAGRSAICADSGGISEIASMGKVVKSYRANDVSALAAIMTDALKNVDLWRGGGFKDTTALENFDEDNIASRYRQVYTARK